MSAVDQITLTNFRNYESARLQSAAPIVVITGENGAGKTNLLEAVSLLSPGRGLRHAQISDLKARAQIANDVGGVLWGVAGDVDGVAISTGANPKSKGSKRRVVQVNGVPVAGQYVLADHVSMVWLTPQMDGLFLDDAGARRRFVDRLVYAFDPAHAGRVNRYEKIMRQRNRLLKEGRHDPAWFDALHRQMAETGVAVAAARLDMITRLDAMATQMDTPFPRPQISLIGSVENNLFQGQVAVQVEQDFYDALNQALPLDRENGKTSVGPHRSDMATIHRGKNMPAHLCSTGEQKALLIGIVLAHALMLQGEHKRPPVLLLDDIAAHLDEFRRQSLFDLIQTTAMQCWMTGTEVDAFSMLKDKALFAQVKDNQISE